MKIRYLLLFAATALLDNGCVGESYLESNDVRNSNIQDIFIDINQTELKFGYDSVNVNLRFDANFYWHAELSYAPTEADEYDLLASSEPKPWYSIYPEDNYGKLPVNFKLTRNIEKFERQIKLHVTSTRVAGSYDKVLTIIQAPSPAMVDLGIEEGQIKFGKLGGVKPLFITATEAWTFAPEHPWAVLKDADGNTVTGGVKGRYQEYYLEGVTNETDDDRLFNVEFISEESPSVKTVAAVAIQGKFQAPDDVAVSEDNTNDMLRAEWSNVPGMDIAGAYYVVKAYDTQDLSTQIASSEHILVADMDQANVYDLSLLTYSAPNESYVGSMYVVVSANVSAMGQSLEGDSEPVLVSNNRFDFQSGDGSSASPYVISSYRHLKSVQFALSAHYTQSASFNVGNFIKDGEYYHPIGSRTAPFTGTYDGGGFEISGLKLVTGGTGTTPAAAMQYVGMFGYIKGEGAVVKNIKLKSPTLTVSTYTRTKSMDEAGYIGYIAGRNDDKARIENCSTEGSALTALNVIGVFIGGIAGGNTNNAVIRECTTSGTMMSYQTSNLTSAAAVQQVIGLGGIVGINGSHITTKRASNDPDKSTVVRCVNNLKIGGEDKIVDSSTANQGIPANQFWSEKTKPMTADANISPGMGGIAGINDAVLDSCVNRGSLRVMAQNVGGVMGGTSTMFANPSVKVRFCGNEAYVSNDLPVSNRTTLGGVVGAIGVDPNTLYSHNGTLTLADGLAQIKNCYNTGDLYSVMWGATNNPVAGGIVGAISGTQLIDCFAACKLEVRRLNGQTAQWAGMAGWVAYDIHVENCFANVTLAFSGNLTDGRTRVGPGYGILTQLSIGTTYSADDLELTATNRFISKGTYCLEQPDVIAGQALYPFISPSPDYIHAADNAGARYDFWWDDEANNRTDRTPKVTTAANFAKAETFPDYNFSTVWTMGETNPVLQGFEWLPE